MTIEQKNLLKMTAANAFQLTSKGVKSDWAIRENDTEVVMMRMPKSIQDADIFRILDFMKKTELEAFNTGIRFQKGKENAVLRAQITEQNKLIEAFKAENLRLVNILEATLPEEV